RALSLTKYSGTLKPKTSLGISAFARIIERKTHGYLGAAPAAIGCQWRRFRGVLGTFVGTSPKAGSPTLLLVGFEPNFHVSQCPSGEVRSDRTMHRKPMWLIPVSIICGWRAAGR